MDRISFIGIGNVGRGDDGVAHHVLDLLEASLSPGEREHVGLLRVHQLDFGMAADIAETELVVFVDAERRTEPAVRVDRLSPGPGAASLHGVDATGLLGLAKSLYAATPEAWLVSVAAPEMEHAEGLSETAETASFEAASAIRTMLDERAV